MKLLYARMPKEVEVPAVHLQLAVDTLSYYVLGGNPTINQALQNTIFNENKNDIFSIFCRRCL